ncbi:hypothetical protein C7M84_021471 [Penaeus vannamei]|uniref:Uncharacterized protein n=1 Tax=Penaeus vannamei TaxID=6689 RepID=A0A3R7SH02_PENVA|nr:hypothetical protein C7M84_021471 [Penaeus vannamei]
MLLCCIILLPLSLLFPLLSFFTSPSSLLPYSFFSPSPPSFSPPLSPPPSPSFSLSSHLLTSSSPLLLPLSPIFLSPSPASSLSSHSLNSPVSSPLSPPHLSLCTFPSLQSSSPFSHPLSSAFSPPLFLLPLLLLFSPLAFSLLFCLPLSSPSPLSLSPSSLLLFINSPSPSSPPLTLTLSSYIPPLSIFTLIYTYLFIQSSFPIIPTLLYHSPLPSLSSLHFPLSLQSLLSSPSHLSLWHFPPLSPIFSYFLTSPSLSPHFPPSLQSFLSPLPSLPSPLPPLALSFFCLLPSVLFFSLPFLSIYPVLSSRFLSHSLLPYFSPLPLFLSPHNASSFLILVFPSIPLTFYISSLLSLYQVVPSFASPGSPPSLLDSSPSLPHVSPLTYPLLNFSLLPTPFVSLSFHFTLLSPFSPLLSSVHAPSRPALFPPLPSSVFFPLPFLVLSLLLFGFKLLSLPTHFSSLLSFTASFSLSLPPLFVSLPSIFRPSHPSPFPFHHSSPHPLPSPPLPPIPPRLHPLPPPHPLPPRSSPPSSHLLLASSLSLSSPLSPLAPPSLPSSPCLTLPLTDGSRVNSTLTTSLPSPQIQPPAQPIRKKQNRHAHI